MVDLLAADSPGEVALEEGSLVVDKLGVDSLEEDIVPVGVVDNPLQITVSNHSGPATC